MESKLIVFVLYLNVDGYSQQHVAQILTELNKQLNDMYSDLDSDKYTIKNMTIPVRDQETKYDCVYSDATQPKTDNYMLMFYDEIIKSRFDALTMTNINNIMRRIKIKKLLKKSTN